MIFSGIALIILGIILYAQGDARSNDIDAIMSDFFNDGVANDGSDMMTLGLVLIGVGVVLLVVGAILRNKKNTENNTTTVQPIPDTKNVEIFSTETKNDQTCSSCGYIIQKNQKFCTNCGTKIETCELCTKCGTNSPVGSNFCMKCGEKIENTSNTPMY